MESCIAEEQGEIFVVAIMSLHRDPAYWKYRKYDDQKQKWVSLDKYWPGESGEK